MNMNEFDYYHSKHFVRLFIAHLIKIHFTIIPNIYFNLSV